MKHNKHSQNQNPKLTCASRPAAVADLASNKTNIAPSPDEVAKKAYLNYVNQGSQPGHEVQHWLAAEADLIAERKSARIHAL
jgi:Protein of unknown function (DUF2934)